MITTIRSDLESLQHSEVPGNQDRSRNLYLFFGASAANSLASRLLGNDRDLTRKRNQPDGSWELTLSGLKPHLVGSLLRETAFRSLDDRQLNRGCIDRVRTNQDVYTSRFDYPLHLRIENRQLICADLESHSRRFAGFKMDSLETS